MRGLVLVRLLPLLFTYGLAAPRTDSRSEQSDNINLLNPFTPGEEHLSILHEYLQEKDPLGENDTNMTRETTILRLFVLHDYDKSGLLDGLELMQLISGVLTKGLKEKPAESLVISVVDDVLEKQDVNLDGLLSAQELVNTVSNKEEKTDPAQVVIPPPMGVPAEEPPAPVDGDLSNKEEPETPELHNEPAEVHDIPPDQTNDLDPPPPETMGSQEEAEVVHHEEDVVEEVISEVEVEEIPGEEEDDKPDDEM